MQELATRHNLRLLIVTQAVDLDDPILGFFHSWIVEFAKHAKEVKVITLMTGRMSLPSNVHVVSLQKTQGCPRIKLSVQLAKILHQEIPSSDAIFIHMCPEYALIAAPFAKYFSKPLLLWYIHKTRNLRLRIALRLADLTYTASPTSISFKGRKIVPIGHGIDTEKFTPDPHSPIASSDPFRILAVGRIAPSKNYQLLIEAINILVNKQQITDIKVNILGSDRKRNSYLDTLTQLINTYKLTQYVTIQDAVPNDTISRYYHDCDMLVNLTDMGSFDKVVLEAMSSGKPVLVSNSAFIPFLASHATSLLFKATDEQDLAQKIMALKQLTKQEQKEIGQRLRTQIIQHHSLNNLIKKILEPVLSRLCQ